MLLLQENLSIVVGALLLVVVAGVRSITADAQLKKDLRGALILLLAWAVLRSLSAVADELLPETARKGFQVAWSLAFAFGCVRTVVSLVLAGNRRVSRGPGNKILRDVVDAFLYVATAIPILKTELKIDVTTMLGTSAVLSLVLGLALQDTLGNLFAGLSVQFEHPFEVGDHITVGQHTGRVLQIAWRSTRIETFRREVITLPNSQIAKEAVKNYSRGGQPVAIDLKFTASYAAPPNQVKEEVLEALVAIPLALKEPKPQVWVLAFEESAMQYQVRYFVNDYAAIGPSQNEILSALWYRFGRAGIEIPFPQRVVTMRQADSTATHVHQALLAELDLFKPFTENERVELANHAHERKFGRGEHVIDEGAEGHTFFVVTRGSLSVRVGPKQLEVARLGRGNYFGEMSLLTGEPRSATVIAIDDAVLLEFDREAFGRHFAENSTLATRMAELLSKRQSELKAIADADSTLKDHDASNMLARLKQIFRLRS